MNDPLPVQSLEYDTESSRESFGGMMRALGLVLAGFGGIQALVQGFAVVSALANWGDPFLKRTNFPGRPSPDVMMAMSLVASLGGIVATVAGIGCMARQPWARWAVLTFAIMELVCRTTALMTWLWSIYGMQTNGNIDFIMGVASSIAHSVGALAFPAILIILVKQRRLWEP